MNETQIKEFTLPIGPMHVALEEPMFFRVEVEGERVHNVEITSGHVHRGMEALATKRNIYQNIVLTERVCSLCSNSHPLTYCMAIENLAEIDIPERALYLRALAEEIKRVASHLFNVAILPHIIGFKSMFMHMMEVREIMQDVKETLYGNRMDLAANTIGGVKRDITPELFDFTLKSLDRLEKHVHEIINIFQSNPMIRARTVGVGNLPLEAAIYYGLVGPVARGSGLKIDVRRDAPYGVYPELEFDVITETGGDVYSRAMVRLRETLESMKIIRQIAKRLPAGKLLSRLPVIPTGEGAARTEAPRGELFYYIRTNETDIPERLKWRVPSYMNWAALEVMMKGATIADVAMIVNSIDPCVSCTER